MHTVSCPPSPFNTVTPSSHRLHARLYRSLYNNIKAPSQLQPSATYYLFKDGIEPKWEDPRNTHGGSWTCQAPRAPNGRATLDAWWLHAVLACIGEQFDEGDEICGVTLNIRCACLHHHQHHYYTVLECST